MANCKNGSTWCHPEFALCVACGKDNLIRQLQDKYHDLLYQVARKHPGESRHETAKRYIQEAETPQDNTEASATIEQEKDDE